MSYKPGGYPYRRSFADQIVLVVVLVLDLRVCFSEQAGTAPNPFLVWNFSGCGSDFERPYMPKRSRHGLSKALGRTNHFENKDEYEDRDRRGVIRPRSPP
jgi:hypothetical protein